MMENYSDAALRNAAIPTDKPARSVFPAMGRGARGKCPSCGEGRIFGRYLKVVDYCAHCGEALYHHRADDAPPYFTIFVAAHLIIPLMLGMEVALRPDLWVHMLVWIPATIALCLLLLPVIKGAIVGLQWALYMHGFDPNDADIGSAPTPGRSDVRAP